MPLAMPARSIRASSTRGVVTATASISAREGVTFAFAQRGSAGRTADWQTLGLQFLGFKSEATGEEQEPGTTKVNYLIGNDPSHWHARLPTYRRVVYRYLWPGIDLVFRQAEGRLKLKHEFPGSTRRKGGRHPLGLSRGRGPLGRPPGNLLIRTSFGTMVDQAPTSYQVIDARRVEVESRFATARHGDRIVAYGFAVGRGHAPGQPQSAARSSPLIWALCCFGSSGSRSVSSARRSRFAKPCTACSPLMRATNSW